MVDAGIWGIVFIAGVGLFLLFKGPKHVTQWAHSIGGAKRAFEKGVKGEPLEAVQAIADAAPKQP